MSEVDWGKHIRKSKATVHTGKPARRTRAHTHIPSKVMKCGSPELEQMPPVHTHTHRKKK